MDIEKLGLNDTFDVEIKMPDGSETDIVITVCGPDSEQYKKSSYSLRQTRMEDQRKGVKMTPERLDIQSGTFLAGCIYSWKGLESGGEPLECNVKTATDLITKHSWIKEQIDEAISNRVNFM